MEKDSGHALSELAVDGGVSNSDLTMQVSFPSFSFCVTTHKTVGSSRLDINSGIPTKNA